MTRKMFKFCNKKSVKSSGSFSDFFTESSSKEKKRIIKETVRNANEDQKNLVSRHKKVFGVSR